MIENALPVVMVKIVLLFGHNTNALSNEISLIQTCSECETKC